MLGAIHAEAIPPHLQRLTGWVPWSLVPGPGKARKMPYGGDGWEQRPYSWHEAYALAVANGCDGLGLMPGWANSSLGVEGYWLVLLDFDGITEVSDDYLRWLCSLHGIYAERSPSGNGVRIAAYASVEWVQERMDRGRRQMVHPLTGQHCGELFAYSGYCTMTGAVVHDSSAQGLVVLDRELSRLVPERTATHTAVDTVAWDDDAEPLDTLWLTAAQAAIVKGDRVAGEQISEEVLGCLTAMAPQCADAGELAARAWVTGEWAHTYWGLKREGNINAARELCASDSAVAWAHHLATAPAEQPQGEVPLPGQAAVLPWRSVDTERPPAVELIPGLIHSNDHVQMALVYGPSGAGKSWFAYELALAGAPTPDGGYRFGGVALPLDRPRCSLILVGEAPLIAESRLAAMAGWCDRDHSVVALLDDDRAGFGYARGQMVGNSAALDATLRAFAAAHPDCDPGYVIIENAGDWMWGSTIDNLDVRQWVRELKRICKGHGFTLVVEHHSKRGAGEDVLGAGAWEQVSDYVFNVTPTHGGFTVATRKNKVTGQLSSRDMLYQGAGSDTYVVHAACGVHVPPPPPTPDQIQHGEEDTMDGVLDTESVLMDIINATPLSRAHGYLSLCRAYRDLPRTQGMMEPWPLRARMTHSAVLNSSLFAVMRALVRDGYLSVRPARSVLATGERMRGDRDWSNHRLAATSKPWHRVVRSEELERLVTQNAAALRGEAPPALPGRQPPPPLPQRP